MSTGSSGDSYSSYAQAVADAKTSAINSGESIISSIFGGGTYGTGTPTSYSRGNTYYNADGTSYDFSSDKTNFTSYLNAYDDNAQSGYRSNYSLASDWLTNYNNYASKYGASAANAVVSNSGVSGKGSNTWSQAFVDAGGSSNDATSGSYLNQYTSSSQAQGVQDTWVSNYMNHKISNGELYTGTASTSGFDDSFYNTRKQEYIDYAMPQLTSQVQKTAKDLHYAMANRGLLNSGAYNSLQKSLSEEVNTQRQGIIDTGQSEANSLRSQVASQESSLYSQLESSADTSSIANQALSTSSSLSSPSSYTPISNLLSNWASQYLNGLTTSNTNQNVYTSGGTYTASLPSNSVS